MSPSRRPPRAALAMTKVMSAPGTMLSARPASAKARNVASGGKSSTPATSSISGRLARFARFARRRSWLDVGRQDRPKFALPARNDARRDGVADHVGRRSAHVEEMVDREDQQQSRLGDLE